MANEKTVIYSGRQWGKSTLARRLAKALAENEVTVTATQGPAEPVMAWYDEWEVIDPKQWAILSIKTQPFFK